MQPGPRCDIRGRKSSAPRHGKLIQPAARFSGGLLSLQQSPLHRKYAHPPRRPLPTPTLSPHLKTPFLVHLGLKLQEKVTLLERLDFDEVQESECKKYFTKYKVAETY